MSKPAYTKKPKTFSEQVELLEHRGLIVPNKDKAKRILSNISYNRLSNYWFPFLKDPKEEEIFIEGTNFETIFRLYQFDSKLRTLTFNTIEQIEVAIRTQVIYHISHKYNSGYGFERRNAYTSASVYHRSMLRDGKKTTPGFQKLDFHVRKLVFAGCSAPWS